MRTLQRVGQTARARPSRRSSADLKPPALDQGRFTRWLGLLVGAVLLMYPAGLQAPTTTGVTSQVSQTGSYRFVQYHLPNGSSQPWSVATDGLGRVWFVELGSNQLGRFDPTTKSFSEFDLPTPNAGPQDLAVDGSGSVWLTEINPSRLAVLEAGSSLVHEVGIPAGPGGVSCGPVGVTPQHGAVWLTCEFSNQIDEYFPSNGTFEEYSLPVFYSAPIQVLFDSGGNFWFTAANAGMLGYATVSQLRNGTSDGIREFAPLNQAYQTTIVNPLLPSGRVVTSLVSPSRMVFSQDGRYLWITEHGAGSFDRYDIANGTLEKYFTSRPYGGYVQSLPNGIAVGASGTVWVAEHYGNRIANFDPVARVMHEYQIPCCTSTIAGTLYLTTGANGSVWFSEFFGDSIGQLLPDLGGQRVSLTVTPAELTVEAGQTATSQVVSVLASGRPGAAVHVRLELSGVSRTGKPDNLSYTFKPGNLTLVAGTPTDVLLTMTPGGLGPGTYYLTVGARSLADNSTASTILTLEVQPGSGTLLGWWPGWPVFGGLVALGIAAIVFVIVSRRRMMRGPKRPGRWLLGSCMPQTAGLPRP
jgi:virginiamycin B lyase